MHTLKMIESSWAEMLIPKIGNPSQATSGKFMKSTALYPSKMLDQMNYAGGLSSECNPDKLLQVALGISQLSKGKSQSKERLLDGSKRG